MTEAVLVPPNTTNPREVESCNAGTELIQSLSLARRRLLTCAIKPWGLGPQMVMARSLNALHGLADNWVVRSFLCPLHKGSVLNDGYSIAANGRQFYERAVADKQLIPKDRWT